MDTKLKEEEKAKEMPTQTGEKSDMLQQQLEDAQQTLTDIKGRSKKKCEEHDEGERRGGERGEGGGSD